METPQVVCKEVVRDEEVTRRSFNRFFPVAGAREGTPIVEVPGANEVRMLDATGRVVDELRRHHLRTHVRG